MSKLITLSQAEEFTNAALAKVKAKGYLEEANLPTYTIKKQAEAETGYAHTYQLFEVTGEGASAVETPVGAKINIPKDMVVQSATVETVETADVPYSGAQVGDKYIDLVIANADNTHVYIAVNDLVDVYTAGNGIDITDNAVSVVVDGTNANGLSVSANGVALATATTTTAGAMSATDKDKLDNADVTAYTAGNGIDITSHAVSATVDATNANGLSVGAGGLAMGLASTTANGAMSATDKAKLDDADVTAYTAGNGIDITSHAVSAVVDTANANGLSVGNGGLALAAATTSTNGAMSAADKTKLDDYEIATAAEVEAAIADLDEL